MIIGNLASSKLKREVLLEANYDMPANPEPKASPQSESQPTSSGANQPTPEDLINDHLRNSGFTEEQMNQIDQETGTLDTSDQAGDQPQSDEQSPDGEQMPYMEQEVPDDYSPNDDLPKLKILNAISDKEYKLNNLKCYDYFAELYKNVNDTINNNIMNITTINSRQRQIVDIVHNNLSNMLSDLHTYMTLKFGDIYEDNILAYTVFLKRYNIAMKIIEMIIKENVDAKRSEN